MRFAGSALPIIGRVPEAVDGGGEGIVELAQIARTPHALRIGEPGVTRDHAQGLGLEGAQKKPGVDLVTHAGGDGAASSGQIERGADGRHGAHPLAGGRALLLRPAQERIAAQRHAGGVQGRARAGLGESLEYPVDLGEIAGVIGAWRAVVFARAAPEVRHGALPADLGASGENRLCVVALRRTF